MTMMIIEMSRVPIAYIVAKKKQSKKVPLYFCIIDTFFVGNFSKAINYLVIIFLKNGSRMISSFFIKLKSRINSMYISVTIEILDKVCTSNEDENTT